MAFDPENPDFKATAPLVAPYSNRAFITMKGGLARLSFGESAMDVLPTRYHSAVTMTVADALDLARAIYDTYSEYAPPPAAQPNVIDPLGGLAPMPRKGEPRG